MSEQDAATPEVADTTTPDTADTPAEQQDTGDDFDPARALEKIRKANAEAKSLRERAKAAEDARATAEGQVHDLQQQADRATDLEAQLVRERVARKLGLPDVLVERLRGATEDEVMADAEQLVALVAPKRAPGKPVEALQVGSGPKESPGTLSEAEVSQMFREGRHEEIVRARIEGRIA